MTAWASVLLAILLLAGGFERKDTKPKPPPDRDLVGWFSVGGGTGSRKVVRRDGKLEILPREKDRKRGRGVKPAK